MTAPPRFFFEEARFFAQDSLFDKWIKANDVQDIEYEEVTNKTNNNDQRTNLADSLPADPDRSCKELIKYTGRG
jgi:hypothetical protein